LLLEIRCLVHGTRVLGTLIPGVGVVVVLGVGILEAGWMEVGSLKNMGQMIWMITPMG